VTLRPVEPSDPADLAALVALEADAFGAGAWSEQAVAAELALVGETRWVQVAEVEGRVVGYVDLMVAGDTADLTRVVVAPQRRRSGLGRRLVEAALAEAAALGCHQVLLEVAADNAAALATYVRCGFVEVSRRPRYYAGVVDALVLARPL
jgi:ribosomal-protein-alanine N-acetyltransferase